LSAPVRVLTGRSPSRLSREFLTSREHIVRNLAREFAPPRCSVSAISRPRQWRNRVSRNGLGERPTAASDYRQFSPLSRDASLAYRRESKSGPTRLSNLLRTRRTSAVDGRSRPRNARSPSKLYAPVSAHLPSVAAPCCRLQAGIRYRGAIGCGRSLYAVKSVSVVP